MGAARRRAWTPAVALAVAVAVGAGACSGDDDGDDGGGATSTTSAEPSFEERDALTQLSMAATGVSLVANEISLRALQGSGAADYCRSQAAAELAPHRATLEAAADEEVRRRAQATLGDLTALTEACAEGTDQAAVQQAIQRYDASFRRLRQRLDQLLGTG